MSKKTSRLQKEKRLKIGKKSTKTKVDNQQKITKKREIVDNQHRAPATSLISLNNNMLALLIILLMGSSVIFNYIIYTSIEKPPEATGRTVEMNIGFCLNAPPVLSENCLEGAGLNVEYYCKLDYSDRDNVSITFGDNTSIFDINNTGEILFNTSTPSYGKQIIRITIDDGSGCGNSNVSVDMELRISECIEPQWDEFKNNLTTNFSTYACWNAVQNVTIGIPNIALINYSEHYLDLNGANLDRAIDLSNNNITVHSDNLSTLNKSATNKMLFDFEILNPRIYRDDVECASPLCNIISNAGGTVVFDTAHFTTYIVKDNVILGIWDDSDNYTVTTHSNVTFFGAFIDFTNSPVTDGTCKIKINITGEEYSDYYDMVYNSTTELFEYSHYFGARTQRNYTYLVWCNNTEADTINATDFYYISNRQPVLTTIMPNETWPQNTALAGRNLDDYFTDPDGDVLTYNYTSINNIQVYIDDTTHRITLTPFPAGWYGERTIVYFAADPYGEEASSNFISLIVYPVKIPEPEKEPSGVDSGGGGGASRRDCIEQWDCTPWEICLPAGTTKRECTDLAKCGTNEQKLKITKECTYIPTCFDLIKNNGETGVDCGGPCRPCPTCNDGIQNQGEEGTDCGGPCPQLCSTCFDNKQNQGEEGTDCGGPCKPCPTCNDEIQNQGEEGIDCGGPCKLCEEYAMIEQPAAQIVKSLTRFWWILIIIILIALFIMRKRLQEAIRQSKWYTKREKEQTIKEKRHEELEKITQSEENALQKIQEIKVSYAKEDTETVTAELINAINSYIINNFGISSTEKTEQIEKSMKKVGLPKKLISAFILFFKEIQKKGYSDNRIGKQELKEYIERFEKYAKRISVKLAVRKEGEKKESFERFIRETKIHLNTSHIEKAKISYSNAMVVYKLLNHKEKAEAYPEIQQMYQKLKTAQIKDTAGKLKKTSLITLIILIIGVAGIIFWPTLYPALTGFVTYVPVGQLNIEALPPEVSITTGETVQAKIRLLNEGGQETSVFLYAEGPLEQYIGFSESIITFSQGETEKIITYTIIMPPAMEKQGITETNILARAIPKGAAGNALIGAGVAVVSKLRLIVPYSGKYAEAELVVPLFKQNEKAAFVIDVENLGEEDIIAAQAVIDIYGPLNNKLDTVKSEAYIIRKKGKKMLNVSWKAVLPPGSYNAKLTLIYDEKNTYNQATFNIEQPTAQITKPITRFWWILIVIPLLVIMPLMGNRLKKVIIILIIAATGIMFGPTLYPALTGFVTYIPNGQLSIEALPPEVNITAGEAAEYRTRINSARGPVVFTLTNDIFDIDKAGRLHFATTEDFSGQYKTYVIIDDGQDAILQRFVVNIIAENNMQEAEGVKEIEEESMTTSTSSPTTSTSISTTTSTSSSTTTPAIEEDENNSRVVESNATTAEDNNIISPAINETINETSNNERISDTTINRITENETQEEE